jgi:hypothetical protein
MRISEWLKRKRQKAPRAAEPAGRSLQHGPADHD